MKLESDIMGQTERLRCLLEYEEPDRIPCFLMGMPEYGDFGIEFKCREDELLADYTEKDENIVFTPTGDYTVPVFFGADITTRGVHVDYPKDHWFDEKGEFTDHPQMANNQAVGLRATYMGRLEKIDLLPNGWAYMWYEGGYLKTEEAINNWFDTYGWPHELKVHDMDADLIGTNTHFDSTIHVIPSYSLGLYENTWFMMGQDKFAYLARKSPEIIFKIINSIKELQLHQIEMMARVHPLAVFSADDMGQKVRSLLSPAMHHKFLSAARKEVFDAIHEIGAKAIMHSCGNIVDLLPELQACGLDGWQTLEPASEINNEYVKSNFGNQMSFWGAIDNNVLCFGNRDDVFETVKNTFRVLAPHGGYVAGPSHDYLNTKVDNALAMRDAIIEYGKYPINY